METKGKRRVSRESVSPRKKRETNKRSTKDTGYPELYMDDLKIGSGMSIYDKISFIKEGISKTDLEDIKNQTGLDYETLSHILSVTKATLHNKKGDEKFNATISERLFRLAEIYSFGYEIFGDKARFNQWLKHPVHATGGIAPIELLDTVYGMEEVRNIIGRIAWGIIS